MGARQSSEEEDTSDKVFDTDAISFDEDGNLRLGELFQQKISYCMFLLGE